MRYNSLSGGRGAGALPGPGSLLRSPMAARALLLVLAICLLVQGTVVQTHVHFTRQANVAASAAHAQLSPAGERDPATDCPLCRETAMAGAYVLPTAPVMLSPPAFVLWITASTMAEFRLLLPALGWLSRAPPR